MKKTILSLLFACLATAFICTLASAQVPVAITPLPGPFLYTNGPNTGGALAFGCIFTFQAGTATPLATYTDASGVTQNANPTVLNAGGFGQIWFISGSLYDVRVVSSGGTNCALGNTQYTARSVNGSLLSLPNEWQQPQTFDLPISILEPDLQIVFGSPSGAQTTLDIPPTSSNIVLHGPPLTAEDTLLSQNATQIVTNKNLTTGTQLNGCAMPNQPGTYICIPNNAITATVLNSLAKFTGSPSTATLAGFGTITGLQGITVANAGITGTAVIQQSGLASCNFDGATTAGDYVIISSLTPGDCSDSGAGPPSALPTGFQILGQVLSTNPGSGSYQMTLYGNLGFFQSNGTPFVTLGSGAGSGASFTLRSGSTNRVGGLLVTTGSGPASSAIIAVITFSTAFSPNGFCVISPASTQDAGSILVFGTSSSVALDIDSSGTALSASTGYIWNYFCSE